MAERRAYDAFIAYSHADVRAAVRVQRFLEHLALPGPRRRLKVFLDRTDIRSGELPVEIRNALDEARSLIVCCSGAAARSAWVDREIEAFHEGGADRPVCAVLVSDEPDDALPLGLRKRELRYADVRRGWWSGLLRPRARVELVRLAAQVADVELRALIPWDRRRRRRVVGSAAAAVVGVTALGLAVPVPAWQPVETGAMLGPSYRMEAAEAGDSLLYVLSRIPSTERNYVSIWYGSPGREGSRDWLENNYNPRSRLIPIIYADRAMVARAEAALGIGGGALWIGEPARDRFIAVRSQPVPDDYSPLSGEPLVGTSDVWTAGPDGRHHAVVEGLWPELAAPYPTPRSFDVTHGLPVAWGSTGIWLGAMNRASDLRGGGLWHSADGGASFAQVAGFRSVHSILADEPAPGRVLVAEVRPSVPSDQAARITLPPASRIASGPASGEWEPFDGPPHGTNDVLELVGRLPEGPLLIRVDQTLYARTRTPLLNRLRTGF
jgi:hypothetical protein